MVRRPLPGALQLAQRGGPRGAAVTRGPQVPRRSAGHRLVRPCWRRSEHALRTAAPWPQVAHPLIRLSAPLIRLSAPPHGLRWPVPSGSDSNPQSGRPDAFWPGSTGSEVGPGTYSVTHVHPFNLNPLKAMSAASPSAMVLGRPLEQLDEDECRIGPNSYVLPAKLHTTGPQGMHGRRVAFASTPYVPPVLTEQQRVASRAKLARAAGMLMAD
jgi:hypothetical protein